jgi:acetylornithine deacetylase/succinyl-diaminopimelate desuccinylase-like protein
MDESEKNQAVAWLREMVQFKTVSGDGPTNGDYVRCANWLLDICKSIGLQEATILEESKDGKPIVVAKWIGSDASLPVVVLNSHYDVVPGR